MSTRDKKLLIILAGVAILALTYFLIFIPQSNKRNSLKSEKHEPEITVQSAFSTCGKGG